MAIQWGGFVSHMRVGIDIYTDAYDTNTPSINVYVAVYAGVDSTWNFNDAQTVTLSGDRSASYSFQNTMGPNGVIALGTEVVAGQGQNYAGGPTYNFHAELTGNYLGGVATVDVSFPLPPRPPNVPLPPGIGIDSITTNGCRVLVYAPDARGSGIDAYQTVTSSPGADFGVWTNNFAGGTGTVNNLQPVTTYAAATRAHNAVGWSDWAFSPNFTTLGNAPSAPLALAISNEQPTTAVANWSTPTSTGGATITGYNVQISSSSTFATLVGSYTTASRTYTFTGLTANQVYYVRVRAQNSVGLGAFSSTATLRTKMVISFTVTPAGTKAPFTTVTLTGSDANDSTIANRQWTQTAGSPTVTLSSTATQVVSFYAPGSLSATTLTFRYSVTSTTGAVTAFTASFTIRAAMHRAIIGGAEVPMEFRGN